MISKKIPPYYAGRIYLAGFLMYIFMVFSVSFFVIVKNTPAILSSVVSLEIKTQIINNRETLTNPDFRNFKVNHEKIGIFHKDIFKAGSLSDFMSLTIIFLGFIATLIFNFPVKMFFYYKKKNLEIPDKILNYTRKYILAAPVINASIILVTLILVFISQSLFFLNASSSDQIIRSFYFQLISISFIAGDLWLLFAFFWHRSRVQRLYIDHIFTADELKIRAKCRFSLSLFTRFVIASLMTTIFPLVSVLFYVILSFNVVESVHTLTDDQMRLLFGNITVLFDSLGATDAIFNSIRNGKVEVINDLGLFYINSFDALQMLIGIFNGVVLSLVYVILFVRWTTMDILVPIRDLLENLDRTQKGELDNFTIVRSNDEIGQLSEGYNTMLTGLQEREKIKNLFGQYLTKEISDEILKGGINLKGELYEATVMFCDIRDFTSISEKITPGEVLEFLNCYLDKMIDVILENNGIIDKFIGDGILAIFGVPIRSEKHAVQAFNASKAMQNALNDLNKERELNSLMPIKIGIGLHSGNLIAGNVGNYKKLEYTVIGDTVNIASRIEKMTKEYSASLILSEETFNLLDDEQKKSSGFERISNVPIRGKNEKFNLYKT